MSLLSNFLATSHFCLYHRHTALFATSVAPGQSFLFDPYDTNYCSVVGVIFYRMLTAVFRDI